MKNKFYQNVPGWISDKEAQSLYNLCLDFSGNILEIGTGYGKSTSVICESIQDSIIKPSFDSCDLNFKNSQEMVEFYTKVHGNFTVPDLFNELSFSKNKDIFDVTKEYLNKYHLLEYVTLIVDNFHNLNNKYNLIFCDVLYDSNEVNLNLPKIEKLSDENCIWAIHDFNCIYKYFPREINNRIINFVDMTDSLAIFRL